MDIDILGILAHPIVRGTIAGALTAAGADYQAFRNFKTAQEAAAYGWKLAAWRWFQGAIVGLVSSTGIEAMLGVIA